MDNIFDLIGRFHPLIVHLPIGFLLLGLMMMVYDSKEMKHMKIIRFAFFWGTFSTLAAIISGTVQYYRGGYAWEDIQAHLILGLLTFFISFLMYLKLCNYTFFKSISRKFLSFSLLVILLATGHLGGNLTHGKDYLLEPLPDSFKNTLGIKVPSKNLILPPESFQELKLYSDIIQPIFDQKCVSCHNPKKTKGKLLLHDINGIMSGGVGGPIISTINPEQSEILKRINLARDEKKHMPPKVKIQLSIAEKKLIEQWIILGAPINKNISELRLSTDLFTSFFPVDETGIYPDLLLEVLDMEMIDSLRSLGLQVSPIYRNSPLLKISAINKNDFNDKNALVFLNILDHIVDLDLGQTQVTDSVFEVLKELKHLTILKLNHTAVSGINLKKLNSLKYLKKINLVDSNFDEVFIDAMYFFPALEKVYLYGTPSGSSSIEIPKKFETIFDMGNYKLN